MSWVKLIARYFCAIEMAISRSLVDVVIDNATKLRTPKSYTQMVSVTCQDNLADKTRWPAYEQLRDRGIITDVGWKRGGHSYWKCDYRNLSETANASDSLAQAVSDTLQWCHNERDGVSNHRRLDCLLSRLFTRWSKKTSKLRVTGLCVWNSPVTGEFPAQKASNAENISILWRHHATLQSHF